MQGPLALGLFALLLLLAAACALPPFVSDEPLVALDKQPIRLRWLPDGRMLVLERLGRITLVNEALQTAPYFEMPASRLMDGVEYGLFDFVLEPDFQTSKQVYIYWSPRS
jgi:glucose/arabinose dehydrogenase